MDTMRILTENELNDGWIDAVPGSQVSTGYQAQNTNITARSVGMDFSSFRSEAQTVVAEVSGPIDVNGVPFVIQTETVLTPLTSGVWYIRVVAGSTSQERTLELIEAAPIWSSIKNAYVDATGNRVLNWVVDFQNQGVSIVRLAEPSKESGIGSLNFSTTSFGVPRWEDAGYITKRNITRDLLVGNPTDEGSRPEGITVTTAPFTQALVYLFSTGSEISPTNTIYIMTGISDSVENSFDLGIADLAFDIVDVDGDLVVSTRPTIYVMDGYSSTVKSSFPNPGNGSAPTMRKPVAFDGTNLIIGDSVSDKYWVMDGATSTILKEYDMPIDYELSALAYDGKNLIAYASEVSQGYSVPVLVVFEGVSNKILTIIGVESATVDPKSLAVWRDLLFESVEFPMVGYSGAGIRH